MFCPTWRFRRVQDITTPFLLENRLRFLVLDIDNTLALNEHPIPSDGVAEWLTSLGGAGIRSAILSNNRAERVRPFAQILGLPFVPDAKKPLSAGYEKCRRLFGCEKGEMAVIGDQLFTDVWGGCRYGISSILVEPIELENIWFFRCKRAAERALLRRFGKRGKPGG